MLSANEKESSSSASNLEIQQFYYKKGYKEAGDKYYKKGYEDALRDVKRALAKFKTRHDAIEASKYLTATGKISYPEVVKIKDGNGGYQIKIIPPRVEKEFSVYDLVEVPEELPNSGLEQVPLNKKNNQTKQLDDDGTKNSFYGQDEVAMQGRTGLIKNAKEVNSENSILVDKTRKTKEILDVANVAYTENAGQFRVNFVNNAEKDIFCKGVGEALCQQ